MTDLQNQASSETGVFCPVYYDNGYNCIFHACSHDTGYGKCQNQTGERQHHISDSHDHAVHDTAKISGDHAKCCSDKENQCNYTKSCCQRRSRSVNHTCKDITSHLIGSEDMCLARSQKGFIQASFQRIHTPAHNRGKYCNQNDHNSQNKKKGKLLILCKKILLFHTHYSFNLILGSIYT